MEEKNQNQELGLTTEEVKAQIAEVIANAKENREKVRKESKSGELKRNPFVNLDEKGILGEIIRNARFGFVFAQIHSDLNTTKGMMRKCVREPFLCEIRLCINIVYQ